MSSCCPNPTASETTGKFFSKHSKSYARSFRKGKLEKIQQFLIDTICRQPLENKTILDIGSGVGKLHLTLLQRGASFATGIDMSEEMIGYAKKFADKFNVREKTFYLLGDFMTKSDSLPSVEITLLDKVICCYEDLEGLVTSSANKTSMVYALTYPADNPLMKFWFKSEIAIATLFRTGFRPYWHNWKRVPELLSRCGFTLVSSHSTLIWQGQVYERTTNHQH